MAVAPREAKNQSYLADAMVDDRRSREEEEEEEEVKWPEGMDPNQATNQATNQASQQADYRPEIWRQAA